MTDQTTTFDDIEVTIERRADGRHEAWINGELIAKLSPYRRQGFRGRTTSTIWRIVDANNKVDTSGLSASTKAAGRNIDMLSTVAKRLWYNGQADVIEAKNSERRTRQLEDARKRVQHYQERLADAVAYLKKLEGE